MISLLLLIACLFTLLHTIFQGRHCEGKNIKAPLILFRLVCAIFLLQQQHTYYIDYFNREGFTKCKPSLSAFTAQ